PWKLPTAQTSSADLPPTPHSTADDPGFGVAVVVHVVPSQRSAWVRIPGPTVPTAHASLAVSAHTASSTFGRDVSAPCPSDHVFPSQCSMTGAVLSKPWWSLPTAQASSGATACTDRSAVSLPVGEATRDQPWPSQCSTRLSPSLVPPTAQMSDGPVPE